VRVATTIDPPGGLTSHGPARGIDAADVADEVPDDVDFGASDPAALRHRLDIAITRHRRRIGASAGSRELMQRLPGLADVVHFRRLADQVPTPVEELAIAEASVWVKRDDMTSSLYGGNKVRKLEYVLAQPGLHDAVVVTGGGTGSHHVLATVLYCRLLGIEVEAGLFEQPPSPAVTVLSGVLTAFDVPVRRVQGMSAYPAAMAMALLDVVRRGRRPCFLYPGASTPSGVLGYVDCGLEIAAAVSRGECPEPEEVYVPLGSGGTSVGLALGLAMGGLSSRVGAVRVTDALVNNKLVLRSIERGTRALLALGGESVPSALDRIHIVDGYMGAGYGVPTAEGTAALESARRLGLPAEQTYSAKALAAAFDATRTRPRRGPIMFVDTAPRCG